MYALLASTGVVAISEIGDKTQLLALVLACRFRQPVPIILGILVATLANHLVAALAGAWAAYAIDPDLLRRTLGLVFLAMAGWALVPDEMDERKVDGRLGSGGAFVSTTICFFLAEIGDKTQLATAALAARFDAILPVVIGTTIGMLIADVPAVLGGHLAAGRINLRYVRYAAAAVFAGFGMLALSGVRIGIGGA
ncbi:MAG: TMEM165/GDT1 family protein [Dongiaceae bacterium]